MLLEPCSNPVRVSRVSTLISQTRDSREMTETYLEVFAALSEPLRVRIVHLLAHAQDGEVPNMMLDDLLPVGKSTISYHVAILRRAGLISARKAGRNYFYQLRQDHLERYLPGFFDYLKDVDESDLAAA